MKHHRALDVHDIVWSILQHFGPIEREQSAYLRSVNVGKEWRALFRCALVCRAFSSPAIRLLWRELPSLLPLLSLCLHLKKAENFSVAGAYNTRRAETLWVRVFFYELVEHMLTKHVDRGPTVPLLNKGWSVLLTSPLSSNVSASQDKSISTQLSSFSSPRPIQISRSSRCSERSDVQAQSHLSSIRPSYTLLGADYARCSSMGTNGRCSKARTL